MGCSMSGRIRVIGALLTVLALAGLVASRAQTPADPPMEHRRPGGHEMGRQPGFHRSFDDAERWAKEFDDPARDAWQKPDEVLDALHLERSARVADLGAGTGYFSARIAKRVPEGKVFGVDIEPGMLRYLRERAQREHLDVLVPVLAGADSPNLPEPVDLVLVIDTYHHIDNRVAYFSRLRTSLLPGGRVAIVDFKADSPNGPPPEHRIPP
jgi:SAM-dependent methyltransferase